MKVISIIQPWAMLIALGEKRFETRSWSTKYRGPLAIHASKKIDKEACRREPFRSVLQAHGYNEYNLPIGAILATCNLIDCYRVILNVNNRALVELDKDWIDGHEFLFGDYTEGRYAWELRDVKRLPDPTPAKGQLGLWEYSF